MALVKRNYSMKIVYTNNDIKIEDYIALVNSAGWKKVSNEQIEKSLKGSAYIACASGLLTHF